MRPFRACALFLLGIALLVYSILGFVTGRVDVGRHRHYYVYGDQARIFAALILLMAILALAAAINDVRVSMKGGDPKSPIDNYWE